MSVVRKLAILIVLGVLGIVGSGVVYHVFNGSYVSVGIYIILLLAVAGGFVSR